MFLLQCTGRSGSTYFGSLLGSHPDVAMLGEFLYPDPTVDDWHFAHKAMIWAKERPELAAPACRPALMTRYLEELGRIRAGKTVGLDLKIEMLDTTPELAPPIYAAAASVIVLKRANVLKQAVSYLLMMKRLEEKAGPVHGPKPAERTTIRVTPSWVVAMMDQSERRLRRYEALAQSSGRPVHVVLYEDLVADPGRILGETCEFLGLRPMALKSDLAKQNVESLPDIVENYEELAAAVRISRFEYTLFLPT